METDKSAVNGVSDPAIITEDSQLQNLLKPLPKEIIHVIRRGKQKRKRKGYIVLKQNGNGMVGIGVSLCHDDKFSGKKGIDIARKRACRWQEKSVVTILDEGYVHKNQITVYVPSSLIEPLLDFRDRINWRYNLKDLQLPRWFITL